MKPKIYPVLFIVMAWPYLLNAQLSVDFNADNTRGCKPFKVKFTDQTTSSGGSTVAQWQWDFGDGTTSAQNNPSHTYTQDGSYTVRLVVTSNTGTTDTLVKTNYITIGNFLSVNLGNDTAICGGTTITLDGGGTADSWLWNNGATTPTIAAGAGTWWVTVTKNGCTAKDTISIGSVAPLSAQISYAVKVACLPIAVQFTDASTSCPGNAIIQWLWNFGDGTTSGAQNPLHNYTKTGSFTVKLTVTAVSGLTSTRSKSIFLTNGTPPVVNLGNDSTLCPGAGMVLNAGNSGATYAWSTGATAQTIGVSKSGAYSVVVNKTGCIAKDTILVTVKTSPVVSLGNDTAVCAGVTVPLDAGNAGASFVWSTGDITQQINAAAAGTYWVRADEGGCSSSDTIHITTQSPADPAFGYAIGSQCLPVTVNFSDSSVARCDNISQWQWDFGDGTGSSQRNPSHSYSRADSFHVQLTLMTTRGFTASATKTIFIENIPPAISPDLSLTACMGSPVQLTAGIDDAVYRWTPAAGLSNDTTGNPVFTPGATTLYRVDVTKCLVTQHRNIFISVDSISQPEITRNDTMLVSSAAMSYQWYKNGVELTEGTQESLRPDGYGSYTVKIFHPNGCSASSVPFIYNPWSNANNRIKSVYVNCGPNPTRGMVTVTLSSVPTSGMIMRCLDSRGRLIYSETINSNPLRVNLGGHARGQYFIVLEYKGDQLTIPVSVQ